jgi:hypothetical protein
MNDMLATAGDDGIVNVWKVSVSECSVLAGLGLTLHEIRGCRSRKCYVQMNELEQLLADIASNRAQPRTSRTVSE